MKRVYSIKMPDRRLKETSSGSNEEIELNADPVSLSLSFKDKVTLNDLSNVFQLCKNEMQL